MLKQKTILEVKKNDKTYQMECYPDSTWGELFDVLTEMNLFVIEEMKKIQPKIVEESKPEAV